MPTKFDVVSDIYLLEVLPNIKSWNNINSIQSSVKVKTTSIEDLYARYHGEKKARIGNPGTTIMIQQQQRKYQL